MVLRVKVRGRAHAASERMCDRLSTAARLMRSVGQTHAQLKEAAEKRRQLGCHSERMLQPTAGSCDAQLITTHAYCLPRKRRGRQLRKLMGVRPTSTGHAASTAAPRAGNTQIREHATPAPDANTRPRILTSSVNVLGVHYITQRESPFNTIPRQRYVARPRSSATL